MTRTDPTTRTSARISPAAALLAAALVVTALLASCSSSGGDATPTTLASTTPPLLTGTLDPATLGKGLLAGRVYAGPDCNVVGRQQCNPWAGGTLAVTSLSSGETKPIFLDQAGTFTFELPEGSYLLDGPQNRCRGDDSAAPLRVTLTAEETTRVSLWCSVR